MLTDALRADDGPLKSGYEEFFGPMSSGVDYFTHCSNSGVHDLFLGDEETRAEGYLTDLLSRRAVEYVKRRCREGSPVFPERGTTQPLTGLGKRGTTPRCPPSSTAADVGPKQLRRGEIPSLRNRVTCRLV